MWLDFNDYESKYHLAIVISVQGINPITGQICSDFYLEQYKETCPKHGCKFKQDRFCEKCGFKWPKQNYLCTTGTPSGYFWLDGFRSAEGLVRQYLLTAEKMRGVAHNILGEEKVHALGISFFLSKEVKPELGREIQVIKNVYPYLYNNYISDKYIDSGTSVKDMIIGEEHIGLWDLNKNVNCSSASFSSGPSVSSHNTTSHKCGKTFEQISAPIRRTKKLEVAAGACINQRVYDDPYELDFWRPEPEMIFCVNYCTEADALRILEAGRKKLEEKAEGFLQNIPVGN